MKRRQIAMVVVVSVPHDKGAAWARREVRNLVANGTGYYTYAGEPDGVKVRRVGPVSRS